MRMIQSLKEHVRGAGGGNAGTAVRGGTAWRGGGNAGAVLAVARGKKRGLADAEPGIGAGVLARGGKAGRAVATLVRCGLALLEVDAEPGVGAGVLAADVPALER